MFSFGLSYVISRVSIAEFEHVFVCWERYRITVVALRILEISYPANKYSKSTIETLKQDKKSVKSNSTDCVSLLTICNMSKNFQVFFLCNMTPALKHVLGRLLRWVKVNKIITRLSQ